jgi:hypothetical protein
LSPGSHGESTSNTSVHPGVGRSVGSRGCRPAEPWNVIRLALGFLGPPPQVAPVRRRALRFPDALGRSLVRSAPLRASRSCKRCKRESSLRLSTKPLRSALRPLPPRANHYGRHRVPAMRRLPFGVARLNCSNPSCGYEMFRPFRFWSAGSSTAPQDSASSLWVGRSRSGRGSVGHGTVDRQGL